MPKALNALLPGAFALFVVLASSVSVAQEPADVVESAETPEPTDPVDATTEGGEAEEAAPTPEPVAEPEVPNIPAMIEAVYRECPQTGGCPPARNLIPHIHAPHVALQVIRALGWSGDPAAVAPLAWSAAYAQDPAVRSAAQAALTELADSDARDAIERTAATDPDLELRHVATLALPTSEETGILRAVTRPPETEESTETVDPEYGRVILTQTPFTRPAGVTNWTVINLGLHRFNWGISDNVDAGLTTILPAGVLGIAPHLKAGFQVHEFVRVGVSGQAGVFSVFVDSGESVFAFGGSAMAAFGTEDLFLNVSLGGYAGADGDEIEGLFAPSLGFSARVSQRVRFGIETLGFVGESFEFGDSWAVFYGFRYFGTKMFGDFAFMVLLDQEFDEILSVMPLGLPFFSFGVSW